LTLLGLRNAPANTSDVSSGATSITATAFALLAAAYGKDPLADSDFYYGHPNWRRVSFTAGRQPVREDGQGFNAEATIAGVKLLLLDLREVAKHENLTDVQNAVTAAALGYSNIKAAVQDTLRVAVEPTSDAEKFVTSLTNFRGVLTKAAAIPNLGRQIDEAISARIRAQADWRRQSPRSSRRSSGGRKSHRRGRRTCAARGHRTSIASQSSSITGWRRG
jgi:hypothetical protein